MRFDAAARATVVPASPAAVGPLLAFVARHGLDRSSDFVERIWEVTREHEEREEASRAADTDLTVEGLGGELRLFQCAAVADALKAHRTFLADQMGLGKTVEALATVQTAGAYPVLVVCPASLKLNWAREARCWLPGRSVEVSQRLATPSSPTGRCSSQRGSGASRVRGTREAMLKASPVAFKRPWATPILRDLPLRYRQSEMHTTTPTAADALHTSDINPTRSQTIIRHRTLSEAGFPAAKRS